MAYRRSSLMEERLADNRERILRAARQLVAQGGFREAQVSAVAAVAGLSTGSIYRYFPSKAELFVEVLGAAVRHEIAILGEIAKGPGTATQRLGAAVESFARRAFEGPHLAYAFIAEPAEPEVDAARIRDRQAIAAVFKTILREGIASGEFPEQNLDVSAACVLGAFTEALVGPIAPTTRATQDKDKLVRNIVQFCVRAVTGANAAPATAAKRKTARGR